MKHTFRFVVLLIIFPFNVSAQQGWDTYLAQYEKGPGSTLVNLDLKKTGADPSLPFLFSAGVSFSNCSPDGLPLPKEMDMLNRISDSLVAVLNNLKKNTQAGTFTYQCQRKDYFYVPDTAGLRIKITDYLKKTFPGYTPVFNIKPDKAWNAYFEFLYPSEEIMEYIKNQKVILQLVKAGDKLDKPRQVDHWAYFKTEKDQLCFIQYAILQGYKIEGKERTADGIYPYKVHMSKTDKADLSSISKVTLELERQAKKCNGDYDGWETFVIKE